MKEKHAEKKSDVNADEGGQAIAASPKAGRKKIYILAGILAVILVLLALIFYGYYRRALYYRTHFFPNTSINGVDCSDMETGPVMALLDARSREYTLEVTGRDCRTGDPGTVIGTIVSDDIGLHFGDTKAAVTEFLEQQEEFKWIEAYLDGAYSYTVEEGVYFDEELLADTVKAWDAFQKANMVRAKDAYISDYRKDSGTYTIIPETGGTEMNVDKAVELIRDAVTRQESTVDLEAGGCYAQARVKQDDRKLTQVVDTVNTWLGTQVTYDWNGTKIVLDRELLHDWISMENGKPVLDEEQVAAFVKEQASEYDTYGRTKSFTTSLGVELTLTNRKYGWKTDVENEAKELVRLIYEGSCVQREPTYSVTAMQKGANDLGSSYVEADLTNQHLYLYQDGAVVLETDFVSGTMNSDYGCVTPEGIFGVTYKTRNAILKGATYRTPVSYWMPFYGNYGMHDAKWRGSFGGQIFMTNGSHGCINLPPDKAAEIYEYVSEGFPVVCYYYEGAPYLGPNGTVAPEEVIPEEGEDGEDDSNGYVPPAEQGPAPTPVPTPTPELPAPTQTPVPTQAPVQTAVPTSPPTPDPTSVPTPPPTPDPTSAPTLAPTPAPTPEPTPAATPEPEQPSGPEPEQPSEPEPEQPSEPEPEQPSEQVSE